VSYAALHRMAHTAHLLAEYVQVKPVLAVATVLFKSFDCYEEGSWSWTNGYSYVSFVYSE